MATLPTQLGNPPYIGWHNCFCIRLNFQDFSAAFFVYKFFLQVSLQVLLQHISHSVVVERVVMKTIIHYFMYSLIHELNNSWTYFRKSSSDLTRWCSTSLPPRTSIKTRTISDRLSLYPVARRV